MTSDKYREMARELADECGGDAMLPKIATALERVAREEYARGREEGAVDCHNRIVGLEKRIEAELREERLAAVWPTEGDMFTAFHEHFKDRPAGPTNALKWAYAWLSERVTK